MNHEKSRMKPENFGNRKISMGNPHRLKYDAIKRSIRWRPVTQRNQRKRFYHDRYGVEYEKRFIGKTINVFHQ